jgi:hypothetical protein
LGNGAVVSKPFESNKNKHFGNLAVQLFSCEVLKRGGRYSKPEGDDSPYDIIIDVAGNLWRVQVKSTWTCVNNRIGERVSNRCRIIIAKGCNKKTPYHTDDADAVALYAAPFNHWEIKHSDQITGISYSFNSTNLKPTNWGMLGL